MSPSKHCPEGGSKLKGKAQEYVGKGF